MLNTAALILKDIEDQARIDLASEFMEAWLDAHGEAFIKEHISEFNHSEQDLIGQLITKSAPIVIVDKVVLHFYETMNLAQQSCERLYRDMAMDHYRNGKLYAYTKIIEHVDPWYKTLPDRISGQHYKLAIEWLHIDAPYALYELFEESFRLVLEEMPTELFKDLWMHDALLFNNPKSELLMPVYAERIYEEILSHFGFTIREENQRIIWACVQDKEVLKNAKLSVQQRMQDK